MLTTVHLYCCIFSPLFDQFAKPLVEDTTGLLHASDKDTFRKTIAPLYTLLVTPVCSSPQIIDQGVSRTDDVLRQNQPPVQDTVQYVDNFHG